MNPNTEIRRLIVTNSVDWFIFDANDIEKYCTGYLEKTYFKYCNNQLNYAKDWNSEVPEGGTGEKAGQVLIRQRKQRRLRQNLL